MSKGLKLSNSNSLKLISPRGFIMFVESFICIPPVAESAFCGRIASVSLVLLVDGEFVRVCRGAAGVGVSIVDPTGAGMRGGGSSAVEVMTFALSAAAAASIRPFSSSAFSLFSLACASAARDMARILACSRTLFSLV